MMYKKGLIFFFPVLLLFLCCMSGCRDIQIFEKEEVLEKESVTEKELKNEIYYVKEGTRFTSVYAPNGNAKSLNTKLNRSRIVYFNDDEHMLPEHYKGELIAYSSTTANLKSMCLERYEDIGYSFGVYGGRIGSDNYYHMSTSDNTIAGSNINTLLLQAESDEIRLVSIDDKPIKDMVDKDSGLIVGLKKNENYAVELYAGTQYYRTTIMSDVHFLRAFEVFNYGQEQISDTTHGYMCFNTPENLKSGYYNVNGTGLMLYHAYEKGTVVENEDFNERYYSGDNEIIASYSKQYSVNVPNATRDMVVEVSYGEVLNGEDYGIEPGGFLEAPDGTGYHMDINEAKQKMTITLTVAKAGNWTLNVSPKSLEVLNIEVISDSVYEETVCYEQEFVIEEDMTYQMFYAYITGDLNASVHGSIITSENVTYRFETTTYKDADGMTRRYLSCKIPYLKKGTYKVKIYYYKSTTGVENVKYFTYDNTSSDIFIIDR